MGNKAVTAKGEHLEEDVMTELEETTDFTREELETMYTTFFVVTGQLEENTSGTESNSSTSSKKRKEGEEKEEAETGRKEMAMRLEEFKKLFPPLSEEITTSLFRVIDEDDDGVIEFREFAVALSIMSRGSVEDKILLSYQLCDLDKNGLVFREEMEKVLEEVNRYVQSSIEEKTYTSSPSTAVAVAAASSSSAAAASLFPTHEIIRSLFASKHRRRGRRDGGGVGPASVGGGGGVGGRAGKQRVTNTTPLSADNNSFTSTGESNHHTHHNNLHHLRHPLRSSTASQNPASQQSQQPPQSPPRVHSLNALHNKWSFSLKALNRNRSNEPQKPHRLHVLHSNRASQESIPSLETFVKHLSPVTPRRTPNRPSRLNNLSKQHKWRRRFKRLSHCFRGTDEDDEMDLVNEFNEENDVMDAEDAVGTEGGENLLNALKRHNDELEQRWKSSSEHVETLQIASEDSMSPSKCLVKRALLHQALLEKVAEASQLEALERDGQVKLHLHDAEDIVTYKRSNQSVQPDFREAVLSESKTVSCRNSDQNEVANDEEASLSETEIVDGGGNKARKRDSTDLIPCDAPLGLINATSSSTPPPRPPPLPPRVSQTQHLVIQRPHFQDVRILRAQQKLAASLSTVPKRKIQTTNATSKGASFFAGVEQPTKEGASFQKWHQKILAVNAALKFAHLGEHPSKPTTELRQNESSSSSASSRSNEAQQTTKNPTSRPQKIEVQPQRNGAPVASSSRWNKAFKALKFRVPSSSMVTRSHSNQPTNLVKQNRLLESLTMEQFLLRASVESELLAAFDILFEYFSKYLLEPVFHSTMGDTMNVEKQGWVMKRKSAKLRFKRYDKIFVIIKHGFLAYYHKGDLLPRSVFSLQDAVVRPFNEDEGKLKEKDKKSFIVSLLNYTRQLRANAAEISDWMKALSTNALLRKSHLHRYHSFAPVRSNVEVKHLIGGKQYYEDLALNGLSNALRHIYIADWWFVPELILVRSSKEDSEKYRLDNLLMKKALDGVKIYIMLWQETAASYNLQSVKVKKYMEGLHPNIRVILHPWMFPLKWSHHQKLVVIDDTTAYLGGIDLCYGRYDDERYLLTDDDENNFPGRDYTNYQWNVDGFGTQAAATIDRSSQARMPWHDVQIRLRGTAVIDCAYNFIQRWNFSVRTSKWSSLSKTAHRVFKKETYIFPSFPKPEHMYFGNEQDRTCDCQIVRSVSHWSAGIYTESSIYKAYIDLIRKANHFIYIENQFFISRCTEEGEPKNGIAKAILERILLAIKREETFRVIVVMPISPGCIDDPSTRYLLRLTFNSISRGGNSLLEQIAAATDRPFDYITFHVLRNWDTLSNGTLVSEQIYVHSKLMIIDDQIAIIGSANINDRSMRGSRDSEIAAVIEDRRYVDSVMNGKPYKAGHFAFSLRRSLWGRLLAISGDEVEALNDPIADATFKDIWQSTSRRNTHIIAHVFPSSIMSSKEEKQKVIQKVLHENRPLPPQPTEDTPNTTQTVVTPATNSKLDSDYAFFGPSLCIPPSPTESGSKSKSLHETLKERLDLDDSSLIKKAEKEVVTRLEAHKEKKGGVDNPVADVQIGQRSGSNSDSDGEDEVERRELSLEEMLKKLEELRGYLHDFPLDLFKEENLDLSPLTKESFVPKNVYT